MCHVYMFVSAGAEFTRVGRGGLSGGALGSVDSPSDGYTLPSCLTRKLPCLQAHKAWACREVPVG